MTGTGQLVGKKPHLRPDMDMVESSFPLNNIFQSLFENVVWAYKRRVGSRRVNQDREGKSGYSDFLVGVVALCLPLKISPSGVRKEEEKLES